MKTVEGAEEIVQRCVGIIMDAENIIDVACDIGLVRRCVYESAVGTNRKKLSRDISLKNNPSNIFAEHLATSNHKFDRDLNVDLLHSCSKSRLLDKLEEVKICKHL